LMRMRARSPEFGAARNPEEDLTNSEAVNAPPYEVLLAPGSREDSGIADRVSGSRALESTGI
jgi:hypothetical protein